MKKSTILCFLLCLNIIKCEAQNSSHLEGYIVEGDFSRINHFPHSAFLLAMCPREGWSCGSSIVNQRVLLTAAHCTVGCGSRITLGLNIGSSDLNQGTRLHISKYLAHQNYDENTSSNDIALLSVTWPLKFNLNVARVAIVKNPPYQELGSAAGWGLIDEDLNIGTRYLKNITQNIMHRIECMRFLGSIPKGTVCGGGLKEKGYVAQGDSGSGLLVRGFIQVGIVSFKMPNTSKSLVVYTDVGHFYKWIIANAYRLFCNNK